MHNDKIIIFTDGSSRGNPGPGGYGAIIVNPREDHVWELGGREQRTTNNRMELMAAIEALKRLKDAKEKIEIYTDSSYVINGITKWVKGWQENNWRTKSKMDVLNKDLWQVLITHSADKKLDWKYVPGHSGVEGNERADEIATLFADNNTPKLYRGAAENYNPNILNLSKSRLAIKAGSRNGKAYSYISEVDGVVKIHSTWAECEARVKGKKARFKKALSADEEIKIKQQFSKNG